ncbi:MAG: hypothetical protein DWQ34_02025 [Planctomycetota bacterium]|nr:MAG: hypothetical protein DWQ29_17555 [Planctomycetota bacterium]REJ97453.1 MAG: hypothetical protein DWQ34_02025 [Planctomycetota bacterium]REK20996.1 MAG: hypothetical protein DWQ41_23425 [Planctomycetota bacterium]REK37223.1 MAG: hypothetical protein DWQ45_07165 [Planctomycetota bacterium]
MIQSGETRSWEVEAPAGNCLTVALYGVESNRDAIGARLTVRTGDDTRTFQLTGGDGFFASNERVFTIGVGSADSVSRLEVVWPSGRRETFSNLPTGARLIFVEGRPTPLRALPLLGGT